MGRQVPIGTGMFKVCYDDSHEGKKAAASRERSPTKSANSSKKQRQQQEQMQRTQQSKNINDDLLFDAIH